MRSIITLALSDCRRDGRRCLFRRPGPPAWRDYKVPQVIVQRKESTYREGHRMSSRCPFCWVFTGWPFHAPGELYTVYIDAPILTGIPPLVRSCMGIDKHRVWYSWPHTSSHQRRRSAWIHQVVVISCSRCPGTSCMGTWQHCGRQSYMQGLCFTWGGTQTSTRTSEWKPQNQHVEKCDLDS